MDVYDPAKKIGLVLDEWGTWWNVEEGTNPGFLYQQNTLRDALVASVHFDAFHAHADRLVMANIAQTVNVLQAMILTDPDSGALVLTPSYHVFRMNVGHHDATALRVHVDAPELHREIDGQRLELLSVSASTTGDTALFSLTNLDADRSVSTLLDLRGRTVLGWSARILTADSLQAHNTAAAPDAVTVRDHEVEVVDQPFGAGLRVDLPPHSYVTVSVTLG